MNSIKSCRSVAKWAVTSATITIVLMAFLPLITKGVFFYLAAGLMLAMAMVFVKIAQEAQEKAALLRKAELIEKTDLVLIEQAAQNIYYLPQKTPRRRKTG